MQFDGFETTRWHLYIVSAIDQAISSTQLSATLHYFAAIALREDALSIHERIRQKGVYSNQSTHCTWDRDDKSTLQAIALDVSPFLEASYSYN